MNRTTIINRPNRGFSMIELLIAVAIVAIVSSLAYPAYLDNVRRSSRSDARAAINTLANDLERFFSLNGTYTTDLSQLSLTVEDTHALSAAGKYKLSVAAGPTSNIASSYIIVATPHAGTSQTKDTDCLSFSMNSVGVKLPDPHASKCW